MKKTSDSSARSTTRRIVQGSGGAGGVKKRTMRDFDPTCLTPVRPLSADEIRTIREREGASQAVFANCLNVSLNVVSQWERGEKHPAGSALKLLALIEKNGLSSVE